MKAFIAFSILASILAGCGESPVVADVGVPNIGYSDIVLPPYEVFSTEVVGDSTEYNMKVYDGNISRPIIEMKKTWEEYTSCFTDITDYDGDTVYITVVCEQ